MGNLLIKNKDLLPLLQGLMEEHGTDKKLGISRPDRHMLYVWNVKDVLKMVRAADCFVKSTTKSCPFLPL